MKYTLSTLSLLFVLLFPFAVTPAPARTLSGNAKTTPKSAATLKAKAAKKASLTQKKSQKAPKIATKSKSGAKLKIARKAKGKKSTKLAKTQKKNLQLARLVANEPQSRSTSEQGGSTSEVERKRFEIVNLAASENFKSKSSTLQDFAYEQPLDLPGRLSARSAYIMDAKTGETLFAKRPDYIGQPASTIKILTGLIAIESLAGDEKVPASRYAASMPRSKIYLKPGENYLADDLINAVLLSSANDASVALAEKIAGSESAFSRLMTRKAQALGARQTICKSANGLTRDGQQTTVRDLAVVFNNAMKNQEFAARMAITRTHTAEGKELRAHNKALWTVEGAVGGKTGYTEAARKTYVGKFQRGDQSIVVAMLGSEALWPDVATLVEHGFKIQNYRLAATSNPEESTPVRVPVVSQIKTEEDRSAEYPVLVGQREKANF